MEEKSKILIVDDDIITREIVSFCLKKRGYIPLTAASGADALELLMQNDVALLLCDVEMPGLNGYEFFRMVRRRPKLQLIPFIFITAHSSPEEKVKAYTLGVDNFISKPVNEEELTAIVESSLKRAEIRRSYAKKRPLEMPLGQKNQRVLLVDDEPALAKVLRFSLEQEGLICTQAASAQDALDIAHEFKPDLIISDYIMPGIDGFQFRKMLLDDASLKDIPFAFLTSRGDEGAILDGYNLKIKDYLLKDTSSKVLVAKIRNLLSSIADERGSSLIDLKEAAADMNLDLFPDIPAQLAGGFALDHWHQPFKNIPGGDFVDFIEMPGGKKVIVVGDIMGKKWGAWFYTFSFISYLRSSIRVVCASNPEHSASHLLQMVNEAIYQDSKISQIFSAISVLILSPEKSTLDYSGAGDLPLFHYVSATGSMKEYHSSGILLGARQDGEFDDIRITMEYGDRLIAFTDGLTDSVNTKQEAFGLNRLRECFLQSAADETFLDQIKNSLVEFTGGEFIDDVTLFTIHRGN